MTRGTHTRIGRADILARAERMEEVLNSVKDAALMPESKKLAPRVSLRHTREILGQTKSQFLHKFGKDKSTGDRSGHYTWFTVEEVQKMAEQKGLRHPHAQGHGIVITIANFKGGVLKTSTTITLAQYLSLRGLRCLVIDLDPQASATTLFGINPYSDVKNEESAFGLFDGQDENRLKAVRKTYWPGIDLIAANLFLYGIEFALAGNADKWGGDVFSYLHDLMPELRAEYDVILVDTQPSLSFVTANGIFSSDHLLVTVPPSSLDFASSAGFWKLLKDVMASAENAKGEPKFWENVSILLTKWDSQDKAAHMIRQLLQKGCDSWLLPEPIPATRVATNASAEFQTVYDIERYEGSHRSMKAARENYDKAYRQVLLSLNRTWDIWEHPELWDIKYTPTSGDIFAQQPTNEPDKQVAA
jgi:chromosome partitioning protein